MKLLFGKRIFFYSFIVLVVFGIVTYIALIPYFMNTNTAGMAYVVRTNVSYIVTISGKIEAEKTALLNFPVTGIVQNVLTTEGAHVTQGDVLASITQDSLVAEYTEAQARLRFLEASRKELLRGPRATEREVTQTNVAIAREALARTEREHAHIVQNARELVRSSELIAVPTDKLNNDTPPTITGNYTCEAEGTYVLKVFNSRSSTDLSYTLTGLETGTYTGYTDTASPLGSCGLYIQFDATEAYRSKEEWTISVPNTRGTSHLENMHAYRLAIQQQENAIDAARQALELAEKTERDLNAPPTIEAIEQIDAQITEARAVLKAHEARIAEYTIRAPFDGLVTDVDMKIGEVADSSRSIIMIYEGGYKLKARISEVDVTKIHLGDTALVRFDAVPNEQLTAKIDFISPRSSEIDGVAYYEASLTLETTPSWVREGLNADINIIVAERVDTAALLKHFIFTEGSQSFVYVVQGEEILKTPVEIGLVGNAGLTEVLNLPRGTAVTRPE